MTDHGLTRVLLLPIDPSARRRVLNAQRMERELVTKARRMGLSTMESRRLANARAILRAGR